MKSMKSGIAERWVFVIRKRRQKRRACSVMSTINFDNTASFQYLDVKEHANDGEWET